MNNPSSELREKLDSIFNDLIFAINNNEATSNYIFREDDVHIKRYKSKLAALLQEQIDSAVEKHLDWWKADIVSGFIPKCSYCGTKRKVVGQTARGKDAQENNHRPCNWGYYCQKCYDIGSELEREAMYG